MITEITVYSVAAQSSVWICVIQGKWEKLEEMRSLLNGAEEFVLSFPVDASFRNKIRLDDITQNSPIWEKNVIVDLDKGLWTFNTRSYIFKCSFLKARFLPDV